MNPPIRIALIGAGSMGANHARVIDANPDADLVAVVDPDPGRAAALAGTRPTSRSIEELPAIDAAVIASPTDTHLHCGLAILERGVPLLVEKPLATTVEDTESLLSAAAGVPLMCGFVERFNPAVDTTLAAIEGPPIHVMSVRHSPPAPRIRSSVVSDLLIHDIDLAMHVTGGAEVASTAQQVWTGPSGLLEVADASLRFAQGTVATLSASRMSQRKIRSLSISTETTLVETDLLRSNVTVYRHRFHEQVDVDGPTYRAETLVDIPFVRHGGEPLALQLDHFLGLVRGEHDPEAERATILPPHRIADLVESSGSQR